ncbi:uncharacterized protein EI90DRAFT_3143840 [Cantharellus anzutake]|uniref:uncharacterized protein n=1 Tax=Cantharellus anzutake TaxID=1750568 RepID=UPI001907A863|nr:uncharacterized protein EI90DRAFT_3143840 [Cantharellus anzutake]KAF8340374.1 hypothetical protein EI90DRAFT_3143840 [Cantharellus anzutake]
MNPAVSNLMFSLGAMQVARKIPMDDLQVLNYVRAGYAVVQLFVIGIYFYVSSIIKKKNDLAVLKYVEPSPQFSQEPPKVVQTTVKDYDLTEVSKALRGVYMGIAMLAFMHLYLKYTQPLFIQAVMGLKNLFEAKELAIHLFGKKADGDLKRPFKAGPGLFGMEAPGPSTDPAAIKAAEDAAKKKSQ